MPRRARLALAGVAWHIIQRGNNRSARFFADEDCRRYLYTLQQRKSGTAPDLFCPRFCLSPVLPNKFNSCVEKPSSCQ